MRGSTSRQAKNKHWSLNWNLKSSIIGEFLCDSALTMHASKLTGTIQVKILATLPFFFL